MTDLEIRRLVIEFDGHDEHATAVETGVWLAASLSLELQGRFFEDASLLRVAALPVTRRFVSSSPEAQHLDPSLIESAWRRRAARARAAVAGAAERRRMPWSFVVVRESPRAEDRELVLVTSSGRSSRRGVEQGPIRILDDGSGSAQRAVDLAHQLRRARRGGTTGRHHEHDRVERWIDGPQTLTSGEAERTSHGPADLRELAKRVAQAPGGLLLVPRDHRLAKELTKSRPWRLACTVAIVA